MLLVFLSYGCAFLRGLSEPEVQPVEISPPPVVEKHEPVVSYPAPQPKREADSQEVASTKRPLTREEIRQMQRRLKAAGFDPGPVDGILGPKTKAVLLRVQAGCTIVNELVAVASISEVTGPATATQAPDSTAFADTLTKAEVELLQKRLKGAGFDPGPIDGILGSRTRSAISRCKSGCTALNDLLAASDQPLSAKTVDLKSSPARVSAQPVSETRIFRKREIRLAQERLKAAGFDPGPLDGVMGPRTKSALEKYRSMHKLRTAGIEALLDY